MQLVVEEAEPHRRCDLGKLDVIPFGGCNRARAPWLGSGDLPAAIFDRILQEQVCPQWPLRTPTPSPQLVLGVNGLAEVVVLSSKIRNILVRILLAESQQPC